MARKNLKKPKKIVDSLVKALFVTGGMLLLLAGLLSVVGFGSWLIATVLENFLKIDGFTAEKTAAFLTLLILFFGAISVTIHFEDEADK